MLAAIRDKQSTLAPETNTDDRTPGRIVFGELRREAQSGISRLTDAVGPASAVVDANSQLARLRAIDRIQTRREAGELARPSDGKAVRDIRQTAYDALTAALESSSQSALARTVLVDAGHKVMAADRALTHHQGEISASTLDSSVADSGMRQHSLAQRRQPFNRPFRRWKLTEIAVQKTARLAHRSKNAFTAVQAELLSALVIHDIYKF